MKGRLKRYRLLEFNKLEDTLKLLVKAQPLGRVLIHGYPIWTDTDRYENLLVHGCKCAKCGLEASFAAIEKDVTSKDKFHINVYGTRKSDGKHIQMTKDHIFPRAMGGLDIIENYQTLCESCNTKKQDNTDITVEEAIERGLTTREIQDITAILNQKKEELDKVQKEYNQLKAKFHQLLPHRDKREFR